MDRLAHLMTVASPQPQKSFKETAWPACLICKRPLSHNLLAIEGCTHAGPLIQDNLGLYTFQKHLLLQSNILVSN